MSNLIDRQAAIDALAKWLYGVFGIKESDGTATIFKRFRELPSAQPEVMYYPQVDGVTPSVIAQPERKKGRWIDLDDHVMCSCCGATHYGADKNYCPNCGADCRGDNNG